jgi:hypothetical protein
LFRGPRDKVKFINLPISRDEVAADEGIERYVELLARILVF